MAIISKSFFHFTNSIDSLVSILENKFYPRYCIEDISFIARNGNKKQVAIPMVCFCDIPLTNISNHINTYGSYGIGLSEKWGRERLNPLFYFQEDSIPIQAFRSFEYADETSEVEEKNINNIFTFTTFFKPYEGVSNKNGDKTVFYNEREWRWIPSLTYNDDETPLLLFEGQFNKRDEYNKAVQKQRLEFEVADITYIIVPSLEEKKRYCSKII